MKGFFITGTNTEVGKTYITVGLLNKFKLAGYKTAALKPVAAGCELTNQGWRNIDAQQLYQAASLNCNYEDVNPFALPLAIAPHIAAEQENIKLSVNSIYFHCQKILNAEVDYVFIEGAGGWLAPLNEQETFADLASRFKLPVIVVVGMQLGCLNHTLLTLQAINNTDLRVAAWVANCINPQMPYLNENIDYLQQHINAPLLARVNWDENPSTNIDIAHLI